MGLIKSLINEGTQFVQYQSQHSQKAGQSSGSSRGSPSLGSYVPPSAGRGYPTSQYPREQPRQDQWNPPQQYGYSDRKANEDRVYADDHNSRGYEDGRRYQNDGRAGGFGQTPQTSGYDAPPSYDETEDPSYGSKAMEAQYRPNGLEKQPYPGAYQSGSNQDYYSSAPQQSNGYPSQSSSRSLSPSDGNLAAPVIIPPQRPGNVGRGFRAAYAPDLQYAGIDQSAFLHFLHDLNEGCTDSKALMPVQVACFGAGMAPSVIAMAVTMAVSKASQAANQQYVRHKVNVVLDKYNQSLFAPHGLYVLIMKYDPMMGMAPQGRGRGGGRLMSLAGTVGSMAMNRGGGGNSWSHDYAAGTSGSDDLPTEAAHLVFLDEDPEWLSMKTKAKPSTPSRDGAGTPGTVTPEKKPETKFSHFMKGVDGYLDQRARNNYLAENGQSVLTEGSGATVPNPVFGSNTNLLGRGGGGRGRGRGRGGRGGTDGGSDSRNEEEKRRAYDRYNDERQKVLNDRRSPSETERELRKVDDEFEQKMRELDANAAPKKKITKDVIYLMIVNKPTQAQMDVAASNAGNVPVAMVQA